MHETKIHNCRRKILQDLIRFEKLYIIFVSGMRMSKEKMLFWVQVKLCPFSSVKNSTKLYILNIGFYQHYYENVSSGIHNAIYYQLHSYMGAFEN